MIMSSVNKHTDTGRRAGAGEIAAAAVLEILGALLLFYAGYKAVWEGVDFETHIAIADAVDFAHFGAFISRHFEPLWHICVHVLGQALGLETIRAAGLVTGACHALTFLTACHLVRRLTRKPSPPAAAFLCILLGIAAAIYVPWFNELPYLGQGSPNVWHNPTNNMVRPIGLLVFGLTAIELARLKEDRFRSSARAAIVIPSALLLVLSTLAKPSFVQIYYPALFLIMLIWLFYSKGANLKHCLQFFLMCLPSLAVMILQYIRAFYSSNKDAGGVSIAPFRAAGFYTDNVGISLLLVTAFPLFMLLVSLLKREFRVCDGFALLIFLSGLAERMLLVEEGSREYHGNFSWGYMLALYYLWFCAIRQYLALWACGRKKSGLDIFLQVLASVLLALHVLSGIYYLYYILILHNGV